MEQQSAKKSSRPKTKRRARLPKIPFNNIALSLSGGGFRASAFHLGVMSYLSSKKIYNTSLLERTRILSTVSAGTFAGIKYVTTLKKGGTIHDFYKSVYTFIAKGDLVDDALQYLSDDENWREGRQRTLINAFASIYHKEFESENFGILWNESPAIHLKEISFNATEFNFALPFRFLKSEKSTSIHNTHDFIGNNKIHIPIEVAKEIRLADIAAASSCFPFGFEPINFPDDFIHPESIKLKDKSLLPKTVYDGDKIEYPVGLMDGGIDDNQGVDSVVTAEERMKNYHDDLKEFCSDDKKAVDLFIISDASIPRMESYIRSTTQRVGLMGKWSFKKLRNLGIFSAFLGTISIISACYAIAKASIIFLSVLGTLGLLLALALLIFSRGFAGLTRWLGVPQFFATRLGHFDKLRFGLLYNLLVNRRRSAMKLVSKVFIKQMRWFSYQRVYGEAEWRPRLIMNAIFDITDEEVEKRKKKYPYFSEEISDPGKEITFVANKANCMGTTLWFTEEELEGEKNMLNTVIACGQFNICFNLIEYMEKFLKNIKYHKDFDKYSEETKQAINELHASLLVDWKKFKEDPYWMVNEWNSVSSEWGVESSK